MRGPDWDWGNQDGQCHFVLGISPPYIHIVAQTESDFASAGGEGKTGKVLDIRGWDNESERSVANVAWSNGATNVYRMGHKGKVDLKYVTDAPGRNYYPSHLPVLGKSVGTCTVVPLVICCHSETVFITEKGVLH